MPEFGVIQSGLSRTIGGVPATTQGTTITADAVANTKGAYVELIAATAFNSHWILVSLGNASVVGDYLIDIAIGSAAEQVIIPDIFAFPRIGGGFGPYIFPMFIPSGSRIAARCQSPTASATIEVIAYLFSGTLLAGGEHPSIVSAYGAVANSQGTNIDPGAVAHTDSAWTEITAATDRAHNWLAVWAKFGDGVLGGSFRWMIDIGIGAATEQEIISDLFILAEISSDMPTMGPLCFPYFVPSGSRLTARARCSGTVNVDRDIYLKIYGA